MSAAADQYDTAHRTRCRRAQTPSSRALAVLTRLPILLLLLALTSLGGAYALAQETAAHVASEPCPADVEPILASAPSHDVWLVSSRRAGGCSDPCAGYELLDYWQSDGDCGWIPATAEEFHATDNPRVPTLIFVHGNRVDRGRARQMGAQWVRSFEGTEYGDGAARLVIFTWPSDEIEGKPIEDVRVKAHRSEVHAWYLAALVESIARDVPVGLIGYSYGSRLITAALHLLGGGHVAGRRLELAEEPRERPLRAVLLAAALDYHWLAEGQHHGLALSQVESLVVFVNRDDSLLRLYPRLFGRGGPEALGLAGVASRARLGVHGSKLRQIDVAGAIGRNHDWQSYVSSRAVMQRARREFVFERLPDQTLPDSEDPPPELPMPTTTSALPALSAAR